MHSNNFYKQNCKIKFNHLLSFKYKINSKQNFNRKINKLSQIIFYYYKNMLYKKYIYKNDCVF
jgi:hypothetical protein